MIAAQARKRRPAVRAAVAAPEIPDHLNPGQMRVIPSPRPRPRAPLLPARAIPALPALILRPAAVRRRLRPRPLRRPPEHHPLQNRQVSPHPLQLSRLLRVLRPQPRVLRPQLLRQLRQPLIGLQRRSQHIPQRRLSILRTRDNARHNRHAAQQTRSALANHAPHTTCRGPSLAPQRARTPRGFRILTLARLLYRVLFDRGEAALQAH